MQYRPIIVAFVKLYNMQKPLILVRFKILGTIFKLLDWIEGSSISNNSTRLVAKGRNLSQKVAFQHNRCIVRYRIENIAGCRGWSATAIYASYVRLPFCGTVDPLIGRLQEDLSNTM